MGKRLYKSTEDRALSGVCGGIAEYFNIDSVIVRLLFVIMTFCGVGLVVYIAAAIIIPYRPYGEYEYAGYEAEAQPAQGAQADPYTSMGQPVDDGRGPQGYDTKERRRNNSGNGNVMLGVILIMAGAYLVLRRFFYFLDMSFFAAGVLVLVGIMLLIRRR